MNFLYAILGAILVSLISLVGAFGLLLNEKALNRILFLLVGFGAGGLIGGAFLHLLPEALENANGFLFPFLYVILGFIFFFMLEKFLYWRHCHDGKCEIHVFTYLNLIGDGLHNLIDGLIIGTSFATDVHLGWIATLAIAMHEIPQELGDFGILLYGGFTRPQVLGWNLLSALTSVLGAIMGYFFAVHSASFAKTLLPIAGGGFIYIAACDLIPELHKQPEIKKSIVSIVFFIFGILIMFIFRLNTH